MVKSTSRRTRSNKKPPACVRPQGRGAPARPREAASPAKAKWVYRFGNGKAEGRADMRNLLGGKGAGLAEMANLGLPVPPGFTITTAVCTHYLRERQDLPEGPRGTGRRRARRGRPHHRQDLRRQRQSAAGLGALGRARVDAGHDGHGAQSRPQRRDRRGAGEEIRRPALRLRFLSPLHHDVFRRRARPRPPPLRGNSRRPQGPERLHARHRSDGRRLGRARRPLQGAARGGARRAVPAGPARSSCGARSAPCSAPG